jgi:hypothetical protein
MHYYIKPAGGFLWKSLVTDSLTSEVESGRIKRDWKIRRDNDSTDYTVDQLCQEESGLTAQVPGGDSRAPGPMPADFAPERGAPSYTSFFCLAFYLVLIFLWRLFATANEYDSKSMVSLSIGLDILCLVGLIAARVQIKRALPGESLSGGAQVMFILALVAGIGLLVIRLTSDASWWTGHLHYDCCPPR